MAAAQGIVGLDPTFRRVTTGDTTGKTRRPATLDGLTIGLLSNTKGRATAFLEALYQELAAIAPVGAPVLVTKPGFSVAPTPENWAEITSKADVAVVALGA